MVGIVCTRDSPRPAQHWKLSSDTEQKVGCRNQAQSILKKLWELESAVLVVFWNTIVVFWKTTVVFWNTILGRFPKSLQDPTVLVCLSVMVSLLEFLADFVQTHLTKFDHYESQGIAICGHNKYKSEQKRILYKKKLQWWRKCRKDNVIYQEIDLELKCSLFFLIELSMFYNSVVTHKEVNTKFGFVPNIASVSLSETSAMKHCC